VNDAIEERLYVGKLVHGWLALIRCPVRL